MPYSLVLECLSQNGAVSPEDLQGQKTLALFLEELIHKQDAAVATRLHELRRTKPFTTAILGPAVSGVPGNPKASRRLRRTGASEGMGPDGSAVKIRLTLLDDALYPLVSQFFLQHLGTIPVLHLGQSSLVVTKVSATAESGEPWSGFARFEDIFAQAARAETVWRLHFATPTAFKSGDADLPLPIPRLCFQSWLTSWDEHSPLPFFQERALQKAFLADVVEKYVSVDYRQIDLVEETFYFDGRQVRDRGFVGTCRFWVKPGKLSSHARAILAAMVAYSFYAGTGRKTTMGMGMTRPLQVERARPTLVLPDR